MKSLWNNFKVAFAMFSKIPMPRADWTKENMKYMFCFFPFIGTVIGGLTMLVAYLGLRFGYLFYQEAGLIILPNIFVFEKVSIRMFFLYHHKTRTGKDS